MSSNSMDFSVGRNSRCLRPFWGIRNCARGALNILGTMGPSQFYAAIASEMRNSYKPRDREKDGPAFIV